MNDRERIVAALLLLVAVIAGIALVCDPPNSHKPAPTPAPASSK